MRVWPAWRSCCAAADCRRWAVWRATARSSAFPIRDYYTDIGFDFSREPYEALADEWALLYDELAAAAPLRAGVPETLKRLKRAGVRLTVLSASEHGMLCRQLRQRGVYGLFDEVLGLGDFRAQDKLGIAREWCARTRPARALMIGDTDHDALAARAMGADCVLLTGGHQSRAVLLRTGVRRAGHAV